MQTTEGGMMAQAGNQGAPTAGEGTDLPVRKGSGDAGPVGGVARLTELETSAELSEEDAQALGSRLARLYKMGKPISLIRQVVLFLPFILLSWGMLSSLIMGQPNPAVLALGAFGSWAVIVVVAFQPIVLIVSQLRWLHRMHMDGLAEALRLTPTGSQILQASLESIWRRHLIQFIYPVIAGSFLAALSTELVAAYGQGSGRPDVLLGMSLWLGGVTGVLLIYGLFRIYFIVHPGRVLWVGLGFAVTFLAFSTIGTLALEMLDGYFERSPVRQFDGQLMLVVMVLGAALWYFLQLRPMQRLAGGDALWKLACAAYGSKLWLLAVPYPVRAGEPCLELVPDRPKALRMGGHSGWVWAAAAVIGYGAMIWAVWSLEVVFRQGGATEFHVVVAVALIVLAMVMAWKSGARVISLGATKEFEEQCRIHNATPGFVRSRYGCLTLWGDWILLGVCAVLPLMMMLIAVLTSLAAPTPISGDRLYTTLADSKQLWLIAYGLGAVGLALVLVLRPFQWRWAWVGAVVMTMAALQGISVHGPMEWVGQRDSLDQRIMVTLVTTIGTLAWLGTLRAIMLSNALARVLLPLAALLPLGTIGFFLGPDPGAAIMMVLYPVLGMICIHLLVAERRILENLRLAPSVAVEGKA